jgi:hypothetical protein
MNEEGRIKKDDANGWVGVLYGGSLPRSRYGK